MNNIKWEDGAVCFSNGKQWYFNDGGKHDRPLVNIVGNEFVSFDFITGSDDFQLNEIQLGDYIEVSELDTEHKYNDALEVFELFGIDPHNSHCGFAPSHEGVFCAVDGGCCYSLLGNKRKITHPQLMAIGKLKRAMIERDEALIDAIENTSILSDVLNGNSSEAPNSSNWSDEHYKHFYQLTKDDIERGEVKVDAYFVNRMWKINSWEDTGAGFHILKTLPRIANNKNSLKRELVALKKQVDILCKLHGVKKEDFE